MAGPVIVPYLSGILKAYSLEGLTNWAINALRAAVTPEQLMIEIYQQPLFKERFSGYFELEKKGRSLPSINEILEYENTAFRLAQQWNVPITRQEVQGWVGMEVSPVEMQGRFELAAQAVYQIDSETRQQLKNLYGIQEGQLMKYWLDKNKQYGEMVNQMTASQIAGAAQRTKWGQLTRSQAERLQRAGMDANSAGQGFQQLSMMDPLFEPWDITEDALTPEDQVEFLLGNTNVIKEVEKRASKRKAEFSGSGGVTQGEEGFGGFGGAES